MSDQYWNYIVTFVGLIGFYLGGKKIWWAWYVNIANQMYHVDSCVGYYHLTCGGRSLGNRLALSPR
jgi:xanthosine utilization system XapX-like protein